MSNANGDEAGALLDLVLAQVRNLLEESEAVLGPRELAAIADAVIKVRKSQNEEADKLTENERATSGLAVFPTMPSNTSIKF